MSLLFSKTTLGPLQLQNRLVMSPMTRSRAIGNVPNDLMVQYYVQRAAAGMIITEGTAPSPNALGYARIPGIYSAEQVAGWKKITEAVHAKGAKMICQFMHTAASATRRTCPPAQGCWARRRSPPRARCGPTPQACSRCRRPKP